MTRILGYADCFTMADAEEIATILKRSPHVQLQVNDVKWVCIYPPTSFNLSYHIITKAGNSQVQNFANVSS